VSIDLTTKQEKFIQEWVKTGNRSESYRHAYNTTNMAAKAVTEKALRLSAEGNIRARYTQLMKANQERTNTTVDRLDEMLTEAFQTAKASATPSAMVSAAMALMKLHGLDVETQQKINASDKSESMADALRVLAFRLLTDG
jgi:phage terminase small subunit